MEMMMEMLMMLLLMMMEMIMRRRRRRRRRKGLIFRHPVAFKSLGFEMRPAELKKLMQLYDADGQ
eukprot:753872-Hanusia_phi.AAC.1